MPDLSDLISRVEKASGPDGDLEAEIWLACTPGATRDKWSYIHKATGRECTVDETRDATYRLIIVPEYTTSIDAALTLLPEGYAVTDLMIWPDEPSSATVVGTTRRPFGKDHRVSWVHGAGDGTWRGNGATAPLALLAAILRARQGAQSGQAQTEARG